MYSVITRTTVMFFLVMFSMRLMGKKSLGEFQPSDLVATILISNLTSLVIEVPELPLIFSIVPILLITCYEIFLSIAVKKNSKFSKLAQGQIKVLISNGKINQQTMKDLRFAVDDVLEVMRSKDVFYIEDVALALVETTGGTSIYKTPNSSVNKSNIPPCAVIIDGEYVQENIDILNIKTQDVTQILNLKKLDIKNIFLMLLDGDNQNNITIKENI